VGASGEHDIGAEAAALLAATQLLPGQPTRMWTADDLVTAAVVRRELTPCNTRVGDSVLPRQ